ncbi:Wzz/FepE/Etk N-terminal domain-containing protein [Thiomicrorhabdus sp. zzn3]|uniref:Wzz/FepE/Etk N-terminal domain-containing protein n=1 Tax=Thiomicrorhabdus sp. zzn3 TaxID=3039775 RepID=UPI0024367835|nr:Wzz/FepE/Etk N-terminal domain-containing protein [Thiomicrorhabdus sp. zzn3]MDG6777389.1 Wzz/FepE/Etk N-terminal domain-containing protein [Thiomicrorhabdus sp. zzn3]
MSESLQKQSRLNETQQACYSGIDQSDEIDLVELFSVLAKRKWFIILFSLGLAMVTAVIALQIPNQYQAKVLMVPVNSGSGGGLSSLASKYGGLASMAGIELPQAGGDMTQEAISVLKSRRFINSFITEHELKPVLFYEQWDADQKQWRVESEGWGTRLKALAGIDTSKKTPSYPGKEELSPGEPSLWEAYKLFNQGILQVSEDKKTAAITLSVEWYDPVLAAQWANQLVKELNAKLRDETIQKSQRTIEYLQEQIQQTNLVELREILFGLIEEHVKKITLAKTHEEFVFKVIDPAVVPEEKSKPKRGLIVAVVFVLGLMLSVFIVLIQNWRAQNKVLDDLKS